MSALLNEARVDEAGIDEAGIDATINERRLDTSYRVLLDGNY